MPDRARTRIARPQRAKRLTGSHGGSSRRRATQRGEQHRRRVDAAQAPEGGLGDRVHTLQRQAQLPRERAGRRPQPARNHRAAAAIRDLRAVGTSHGAARSRSNRACATDARADLSSAATGPRAKGTAAARAVAAV
jgi:hypothetical protein